LRTYLFKKDLSQDTIHYWDLKLVSISAQSSEKERNAVSCEREVDDMKKAEYMMKHIGEEYEGMITSILNFGMFVELDNLIEGLVRVDDMYGDEYYYDESTFQMIGRNTNHRYRLGDRVKVTVANANKEAKTVDFVLSELKDLKKEKKKETSSE
ncbi:MAG: S1 RNA-binding domain-containing protein, partial [Firmicutes bacterium]|nr:S1 RNA-binding domain-containing protein [Bacillota bacterium]